jgi:hypothetical protein
MAEGCSTVQVTNVEHRNLALLPDPNNGTAPAMSDERGNLEEKVFRLVPLYDTSYSHL